MPIHAQITTKQHDCPTCASQRRESPPPPDHPYPWERSYRNKRSGKKPVAA